MANPWMKKNPVLSLVLSGANAWAGAARGIMAGAARRQQRTAGDAAMKSAASFWTGLVTPPTAKRKPRRKRR